MSKHHVLGRLALPLIGLAVAGILAVGANAATTYTTIDLGTLGGSWSDARAVNSSGQVVGESATSGDQINGDQFHAFSWTQSGGMIDLGTLGRNSQALAINTNGQVVGDSGTASGDLHAFSWTQAGGMIDLGTLGGSYSAAFAVNDNGWVVGASAIEGDVNNGVRRSAAYAETINQKCARAAGYQNCSCSGPLTGLTCQCQTSTSGNPPQQCNATFICNGNVNPATVKAIGTPQCAP